jgi:hypothetical protein
MTLPQNAALFTWTTGPLDGLPESGSWRAQRTGASHLGALAGGIRVKSSSPRRGHGQMEPVRTKCLRWP